MQNRINNYNQPIGGFLEHGWGIPEDSVAAHPVTPDLDAGEELTQVLGQDLVVIRGEVLVQRAGAAAQEDAEHDQAHLQRLLLQHRAAPSLKVILHHCTKNNGRIL